MSRGRFIALEGIDGSGTTSQRGALAAVLRDRGHAVLETCEPSSGSIGRLAREHLATRSGLDRRALALLFAADRLDHVATRVEPALAAGSVVLTDRYLLSSWAYQSLDCDPGWVRSINAQAPWPDLTLWVDVPAREAMRRVAARKGERGGALEIFETLPLQQRLADAYAALARDPTLTDVVRIDGDRPMEAVTRELVAACERVGL